MLRNRIEYFLIICFAWSWLLWLLVLFEVLSAGYLYLGALGPLVAVNFVQKQQGQINPPILLRVKKLSYIVVLGSLFACLASFLLISPTIVQQLRQLALGSPLQLALLCLYAVLGGGMEEFAWRGYLQPHLVRYFYEVTGFSNLQLSWDISCIATGIIWFIWHIPLFFFQESLQLKLGIVNFFVLCLIYSFILSCITCLLSKQTKFLGLGVVTVICLHSAYNLSISVASELKSMQIYMFLLMSSLIAVTLRQEIKKLQPSSESCNF